MRVLTVRLMNLLALDMQKSQLTRTDPVMIKNTPTPPIHLLIHERIYKYRCEGYSPNEYMPREEADQGAKSESAEKEECES